MAGKATVVLENSYREDVLVRDRNLNAYPIPRRVIVGFILTLSLFVTPLFFEGEYLNPLTVSCQVLNYLFFASTIFMLHREVRIRQSNYPFGPIESMVGAIIPFSYIFWNFCWVFQLWNSLELGRYSFKQSKFFVAALFALCTILGFPDNMDKIPHVVPPFSFLILYAMIWIFTDKLKRLNFD